MNVMHIVLVGCKNVVNDFGISAVLHLFPRSSIIDCRTYGTNAKPHIAANFMDRTDIVIGFRNPYADRDKETTEAWGQCSVVISSGLGEQEMYKQLKEKLAHFLGHGRDTTHHV